MYLTPRFHSQVVTHENHILEKPESEEEARSFLRGYGRTPPGTAGSVVITNLGTGATVQVCVGVCVFA